MRILDFGLTELTQSEINSFSSQTPNPKSKIQNPKSIWLRL